MSRFWRQAFRSFHQRSARVSLDHSASILKDAQKSSSTRLSSSGFGKLKFEPFGANFEHQVCEHSLSSALPSKGDSSNDWAIRSIFAERGRGSRFHGISQVEILRSRRSMCSACLEKKAEVVEGKKNDELEHEVKSDDSFASDEFASFDFADGGDFGGGFVRPTEQEEDSKAASKEILWNKISSVWAVQDVVPIIQSWKEQGKELDKGFLITFLTRLRKNRRYTHALKISEWLVEERPFEIDAMDHIFRIDLNVRLGKIEEAEKLFSELPAEYRNSMAYTTLLMGYANRGMAKKGDRLFEEIKKLGFFTSTYILNHMIKLYLLRNSKEKIACILADAKIAGIQSNIFTYNLLMATEGKDGNIEAMEKIWDKVKENPSVKLDAKAHGIIASAYLRANMRDKAELAMKSMASGGYIKTPSMYHMLMQMYGELENAEEVERAWQAIKELERKSNYSLPCLLSAFKHLKCKQGAEKAFKDLEQLVRDKQETSTSLMLLKGLLDVYEKFGLTDKAEELRKDMRGEPGSLGAIGLHVLVEDLLKSNELGKAYDTLKLERETSRIRPLFDTYLLILGKYAEIGDFKTAEVIVEICRGYGYAKNIMIWNTLLEAYLNARMPAFGIRQRMLVHRVFPNPKTQRLLNDLKQYLLNE